MKRATLAEIRTAIASVEAYQRYARCPLDEAVDVICDYQGLACDIDRRIVRKALLRRQAAAIVAELLEQTGRAR